MSDKNLSTQIQIFRHPGDLWELTRVSELWQNTWEYEIIGRVVKAEGMYYAELPSVDANGERKWTRQPRSYYIPRAAFKAIEEGKAAPEKVRA